MFEPSAAPRLFGLPPGADFPAALVSGLVAKMADQPPAAMARVTLYLNTGRMQRRVRAEFDRHGARFLPRLRLVTDLGRDPLAGLPPPVPALRRRLELAQLVAGLLARQPDFASGTAAIDLADSLARLMAEMQGEGVAPAALEAPDLAENHAAHWERSLAFIRIVARYFADDAVPDAEARQRRIVEALAERWAKAPPEDPVLIAGSTGSRGATLALMAAVARLPQGAVVLPGVDFDMTDAAWNSLSSGRIPAEDHPQYRFLKLVETLGLPADAIRSWPGAAPDPARNRLISLALRPAPVTDQWMAEGANLGPLAPTVERLSLIEAPSPRAEAVAIALRLRRAAEEGQRAALISPDRMLTRRVAAALDRWGILPDDSAGQPLAQSAPGRFLRHVAGLLGRRLSAEALLILLKHPLTATGSHLRGDHLRFTRDLELKLRRSGPPFPEGADLRSWAKARGEAERIAWADWIGGWIAELDAGKKRPLSAWTETFLALAGKIAAGPGGNSDDSELWREEAGRVALAAMEELRREAGHGGDYGPADFADLITALLGQGTVRRTEGAHPLIAIWGTLEARVQGADLVILAGLNEGIWPALPAPDPWLSRQMRLKTGLLLPERQVGLSAHDFQQAAGAPEVILSRAVRDDEAETVPSRWLARLTNLLDGLPAQDGKEALAAMRARGAGWLDLAAALEAPEVTTDPARRPAPRPPVADRPRELAVTGIRTLIRDPYAIYARYMLRLKPLDPLRATPDARQRGQVLHRIVEEFIRGRPEGESEAAARDRLMTLAETILGEEIPWPSAQRIWLAKLGRVADSFVAAEARREARGAPVILEKKGSVPLESGHFTLVAKPDRIDLLDDGRVHIYDYKTGRPPSDKQEEAFEKQLLLEAGMAERGGFADLGPRAVEGATYIWLGGDGSEKPSKIDDAVIARTWAELERLIAAYRRRETGYASRRAVFEARRDGDYDHLARFGEWEMGDGPEPEDVG
ncbi:double-strand break repair protein AddB [Defluviimonas sp. D31]|uniref:double-strand break repair protein AddB n=1 Tax=Defluviimonas sp. D31 TaxID=3083253 RepID=UPI00296F1576|nr:double-strand break repair protein AddB [Defluviimonas sp. D31]MDW4549125.1 double-strand break repair protein AddB [Defluviimonas sp. D31]